MIRYRLETLNGKTFHKFVINSIRWKDMSSFVSCVARARDFCENEIPEDSWSMFNGGEHHYTLFLIARDEDAALFRLGYALHEKDYKGRVTITTRDNSV